MTSYGASYKEFLEAAATPGLEKYRKRYNGRPKPAPVQKGDASLIEKYLSECETNGLGPATLKTSASYLCIASRASPGLLDMDTAQASTIFSVMRQGLKPNSARRAMSILKGFIRWMNEETINTKIDLTKIQKIKFPKPDTQTKLASNMLSGKEIGLLIGSAGNERDRALIAMVYEGCLRPIEAVEATWADLNFDKHGAQFTTSKKTGIPRYIRLIMAAPYLLKWKNLYPGKISSGSKIFVSLKTPHGPITRPTVKSTFDVLLKKSGIRKKVTPYYLRHSRITQMQDDEIPDSIIKLQAWGNQRTNQLSTYSHITNKSVDRILLTRAGILTDTEQVKDESLKPRQCSHCGKVHTPTTAFCDVCGTALSGEAKQQVQDDEQRLFEEFKKFMADQKKPI
jgi:integrase/recombinase XerD